MIAIVENDVCEGVGLSATICKIITVIKSLPSSLFCQSSCQHSCRETLSDNLTRDLVLSEQTATVTMELLWLISAFEINTNIYIALRLWKHVIVTFKFKVLHARQLIVFSFTVLRFTRFLSGGLQGEINFQPQPRSCYDLLFEAAKHNKGGTDRPKTFHILSPPLYLLSAEDAERGNVMKDMQEKEGSGYWSGSTES